MIKVLAIANSDSYLKWTASTLDRMVEDCAEAGKPASGELVLIRGPIMPSESQISSALAGTSAPSARVLTLAEIRKLVRKTTPDVLLLGCAGPVAELIVWAVTRSVPERQRPAFICGMPGIAFVAKRRGADWRRWTDSFIVHSPAEIEPHREAFAKVEAAPNIVLTRLAFLESAAPTALRPDTDISTIVFATQAIVPMHHKSRVRILVALAHAAEAGFRVVVKLRALRGEGQTHFERLPYDGLWEDLHEELGFSQDLIEFRTGPMADWLSPGNALVTVSSTAGLEALALGLPTVFLNDFGVNGRMHNTVYEGSGCLASMDELPELLRAGGPVPDEQWLASNYLHTQPSELGAEVIRLAELRRAGELPRLGRIAPADVISALEMRVEARMPSVSRRIRRTARFVRRAVPRSVGTTVGKLRRSSRRRSFSPATTESGSVRW